MGKINKFLVAAGICFIGMSTGCGRSSNRVNNSQVTPNQNIPVIQSIAVQGLPAIPNSDVTATVVAQSPQGLALTYTWTVSSGWIVAKGGNTPTLTIKAPDGYGISGIATITVTDTQGRYATGTTALSTQGNGSPVISSLTASPNPVAPNGIITAMVNANDPDGDTLSYMWTTTTGWSVTGYGTTATVIAPSTYATGGYITVTVDDGHGGIVSGSLAISTEGNSYPVISSLTASPNPVAPNGIITAMVNANDPDGDTLSYTWTTTTGWSVTGYGTTATVVAPSMYSMGGYITVTVDDNFGGIVTGTIAVSTEANNNNPVIQSLNVLGVPAALGGNITATVTAYSPQGYGLNYTWTVSDPTWLIKNGGATPTVTITAPNTYGATGTATITVSDTNGGYAIGIVALSTEPLTPTTPSAPTNLTATAGNKQVSLNWAASTGAISYNVYTSTTSGGPFKKVGTATTTGYTVTGLTNGTSYYFPISYYFVITAVNSAGESGYSNEVNAMPKPLEYTYAVGSNPMGIAIDKSGNIWVANNGSNNVTELSSSGLYINTYTVGSNPVSIAIDSYGNVWVANNGSNNVTELSSSGSTIGTYDVGGGFSYLSFGIAIDASGNVWVTNSGLNNVKRLNSSGSVIGTYTLAANAFGIAIDASGNAWITNYYNNTVTELNTSGVVIGTYSVGSGIYYGPYGIAIDSSGNVWVTEYGLSSVYELNSSGFTIGTYSAGDGPYGIAIDASGNVWIADNTAVNGSSSVTELNASGSVIEIYPVGTNSNGVAIDKSGNIWVTNGSNNTVTEIIDVAKGPQYFPYTGPVFPGGGNE